MLPRIRIEFSYFIRILLRLLCFRCERLHSDVLHFLGDASNAFNNHFSKELHKISDSTLGPSVILFHETNFTNILPPSDDPRSGKSPEAIIRDHITSLDQVGSTKYRKVKIVKQRHFMRSKYDFLDILAKNTYIYKFSILKKNIQEVKKISRQV